MRKYFFVMLLLLFGCNDDLEPKSQQQGVESDGGAQVEEEGQTIEQQTEVMEEEKDLSTAFEEQLTNEDSSFTLDNFNISDFIGGTYNTVLSQEELMAYIITETTVTEQSDTAVIKSDTLVAMQDIQVADFMPRRARFLQNINVRERNIEREGYAMADEGLFIYSNETERWTSYGLYPLEEQYGRYLYLSPQQVLDLLYYEFEHGEINMNDEGQLQIAMQLDASSSSEIIRALTEYGIEDNTPYLPTAEDSTDYEMEPMTIICLFDPERYLLTQIMYSIKYADGFNGIYVEKYFTEEFDYETQVENIEVTDDIRAEGAAG